MFRPRIRPECFPKRQNSNFTKFGPPADKRDLKAFCNKLTNMHLKVLKITIFYCHSKRVHSCVMHCSRSIKFAVISSKNLVNVAMETVLLRYPIFTKCWSCHRNKALLQQNSFIFEGIIGHTHKRKVSPLIYLNYDGVLSTVPSCSSSYKWKEATSNDAGINLEIWDDGPNQPKFQGAIRPGVWGPPRPPLGSSGKALVGGPGEQSLPAENKFKHHLASIGGILTALLKEIK